MTPNTPTCIETSTGRYVDLLAPDPATICLADIAAHLSRTCRFNGACRRFYSVAEHAILVADRLRSQGHGPLTILRGLHHDDHEAYLNDRTRPYAIAAKALLGDEPNPDLEIAERLDIAIATSLNLPPFDREAHVAVKAADNWALAAEAWHLLPSRGAGWVCDGLYRPGTGPTSASLAARLLTYALTPIVAEGLFIAQHKRWTGLLAGIEAAA